MPLKKYNNKCKLDFQIHGYCLRLFYVKSQFAYECSMSWMGKWEDDVFLEMMGLEY